MGNVIDYFKVMVIVQLFYAVSIGILTYGMGLGAPLALDNANTFTGITNQIDIQTVSDEIEGNLQSQSDMPVVELGALVFYSGNLLIDLLLNFTFAIPMMIATLINGIITIFSIDTFIVSQIEILLSVLMLVMYFIGIIQLVAGLRSGRIV